MSNKTHKQNDHTDAAPSQSGVTSSVSHSTQYQARHEDLADMYKFRNGNGEVLHTPKRSSIARAKALLTTPPKASPVRFTITGAEWPVASVVTEKGMEAHLIQPDIDRADLTEAAHTVTGNKRSRLAEE
ncbi:hypothetical protein WJX82_011439 [Trebouxia sp. C0006]